MGKMMILNGSPRAPRSNSKQYAQIFSEKYESETESYNISKNNHLELCEKMAGFSHVLLVFPLYADAIPVTLLHFLKTLEQHPPITKPVISVLINCGFLEYQQNEIAVEMIRLFCRQNGYRFGSVLKIGSGEAILGTPFRFLVVKKIKKLAVSIATGKYKTLHVTMPLPRRMFIAASTRYWTEYGRKNGITKEQMETMQIEQ